MRIHELHAPVKVVQRSKGRSAVAAAAYRAGAEITDERTGLVHDYTRKQGIENDALLLPANAPEWAHDRAKLWNAAELHEKHPRAQTARDLTVSFPSEFNPEQRREAGLKIGQWIIARYGAAVDIAWHEPSREGDQRNHHAHFLFTTRRWDENGEWAKTKDRTLDDLKKGPEEVTALRLGVADTLNNIAARDRLEVYVEHLSYEKRGLDLEATQHMGPMATKMEREGIQTDIGSKNREIRSRNEQRQALHEDRKVIDIELAREKVKARQQQGPSPAPAKGREPEADPYAMFYRESQARRSTLLKELDSQHGTQEKQLQREIAGIAGTLESAGFFARAWRGVTGRTKADRERMAEAARQLEEIQRQRQAAHEQFERDRQQNLEALKNTQEARQRDLKAEPLPRAVGDIRAIQGPPETGKPQVQGAGSSIQTQSGPESAYESRRREYFRRIGESRKAEREREVRADVEPGHSPAPEIEATSTEAAPEKLDSSYDARRDAYMRGVHQSEEQAQEPDPGPTYEHG